MLNMRYFCALIIILQFNLHIVISERRITGGDPVAIDKPYMVYLLSSNLTRTVHDSWLCGGSIISATKILTSAACLVEMNNLYVIAGYKKYVHHLQLNDDPCTRDRKQRVIQICVPKAYSFKYDEFGTWSYLDIGVALVEKPFDFEDISYRLYCSYIPAPIRINYENKFQVIGTDVAMFGWGMERARQPHNILDENAHILHSASSIIVDKSVCTAIYTGLDSMINKYMLCVNGNGNIDAEGKILNFGVGDLIQCERRSYNSPACKKLSELNKTTSVNDTENLKTRRDIGICQNDHGGPLISWIGSEPTVIGVATANIYKSDYECMGPYLFTSTHCCGKVLQCMLMLEPDYRRKCTDEMKEEGIDIQTSSVNWNN